VLQTVYQVPMLVAMSLMIGLSMTGAAQSGTLILIAVGLVFTAIAHAPRARIHASAREHILDLWAMAAVILLPLLSHTAATGHSSDGMGMSMDAGPVDAVVLIPVILGVWLGARVLIGWQGARRQADNVGSRSVGRRELVASTISGTCCAASLALMLFV
jgi:hypothetical protein